MSVEKNMNTRIQHKHDIEANWNKALNFIPKIGEIIIYDIDENHNYSRFKIGDGVRTINNIEFSQTDLTGYATESYVDSSVANLVNAAPEALNTLNELASALGDDPNFATTVTTEIGKKVDKVNGKGLSTNDFTNEYKNKLDQYNPDSVITKETDPTVPAWAKASTKPTYTAAEVGALAADTLPTAINTALTQAKASGEFDGTSVTVKSVSESTIDGGSNVITFSDGKTLTVKNGSKGNAYTLTDADKSTIVNAVIAALPVYNGEVI